MHTSNIVHKNERKKPIETVSSSVSSQMKSAYLSVGGLFWLNTIRTENRRWKSTTNALLVQKKKSNSACVKRSVKNAFYWQQTVLKFACLSIFFFFVFTFPFQLFAINNRERTKPSKQLKHYHVPALSMASMHFRLILNLSTNQFR